MNDVRAFEANVYAALVFSRKLVSVALGLDVSGGLNGWSTFSLPHDSPAAPIKKQTTTAKTNRARKYLIMTIKVFEGG